MGILEQALAAAEAEREAEEAQKEAVERQFHADSLANLQRQAREWGVDFDPATLERRYNGWQVTIDVGRGCVLVLSATQSSNPRGPEARNFTPSGPRPDHLVGHEVHTLADLGRFIEENGQDE